MGREIRRVPANWQHPKTERLNYLTGRMEECFQALYDRPYIEALAEWLKEHEAWERGEHEGQIKHGHTKAKYPHYANYGGNAPSMEYYRPNWKPEEMTWWQVYETVSEGTPVSPPFATREELVEYLVTNGDFWDQKRGDKAWNRKSAEAFVMGDGWCPSLIVTPQHGVQTGVEALGNPTE